ncbi:MAG: hypothetical protein WCV83_01750 [Candidatus Magasanikbacteria bacterium]|jgi:hypothetical protein
MDKKTKTIVIVVLAVIVVAGAYYGINRWRQQRLVNQYLKGLYGGGVNTGLLGNFAGGIGGGITQEQIAKEIAKEMAKEELQQKNNEIKEAAKTPEDKYDAVEEMPTYDANSKALADVGKDIIEKAFGKAKLTTISSGLYGAGSGMVSFTIARPTTAADLAALGKVLTDKGLPIMQSGIEDKSAGVMSGANNFIYTISFEIGEQEVGMLIMKTN